MDDDPELEIDPVDADRGATPSDDERGPQEMDDDDFAGDDGDVVRPAVREEAAPPGGGGAAEGDAVHGADGVAGPRGGDGAGDSGDGAANGDAATGNGCPRPAHVGSLTASAVKKMTVPQLQEALK